MDNIYHYEVSVNWEAGAKEANARKMPKELLNILV